MGIEFDKTKIKGSFPVFWRGECSPLPGDFKLTTELAEGTIVRKGTPIKLDFDRMECKICKAVKVLTGGTTTKPRIEKDSFVAKGDSIGGQNVSSVDSSNADYDVVTLAAAVESATEGAILAVGTDMSFQTVSAGYEVLILKDVAYPVPSSWLTGFSMKNNPTIKYIRQ